MRTDPRLSRKFVANDEGDPREHPGAQVIDLRTRAVLPQVSQRKPRSDTLTLVGGIAMVALIGALTLWGMDNVRTASLPGGAAVGTRPPPVDSPPPVPSAAITTIPRPGGQPAMQPQPVLAAPPANAAAPSATLAPGINRYAAPTIVFDASALPGPATTVAEPSLPGATALAQAAKGNPNDDFAMRLGGVGGGTASATSQIDPKTTVTQGTLIPAVLETAIDTDVPGYVRAVVSADVRSFDGSRVLVPRSSRLIGQYKSGLQAGQKRAYVIWTRLIRPDGISVNIASPATGFAGEGGLAGKVDTHFFERFGSAMLLSVIGGLSMVGGNAGVIVAGGGQSAAAAAVGQTAQIGPTLRVRPGEPVRVFTARDLDFSKAPQN